MPGSSSVNFRAAWGPGKDVETVVAWPWFLNSLS